MKMCKKFSVLLIVLMLILTGCNSNKTSENALTELDNMSKEVDKEMDKIVKDSTAVEKAISVDNTFKIEGVAESLPTGIYVVETSKGDYGLLDSDGKALTELTYSAFEVSKSNKPEDTLILLEISEGVNKARFEVYDITGRKLLDKATDAFPIAEGTIAYSEYKSGSTETLTAKDLQSNKILWSTDVHYLNDHIIRNNILLVSSKSGQEVINLADGKMLASTANNASGVSGVKSPKIVTGDIRGFESLNISSEGYIMGYANAKIFAFDPKGVFIGQYDILDKLDFELQHSMGILAKDYFLVGDKYKKTYKVINTKGEVVLDKLPFSEKLNTDVSKVTTIGDYMIFDIGGSTGMNLAGLVDSKFNVIVEKTNVDYISPMWVSIIDADKNYENSIYPLDANKSLDEKVLKDYTLNIYSKTFNILSRNEIVNLKTGKILNPEGPSDFKAFVVGEDTFINSPQKGVKEISITNSEGKTVKTITLGDKAYKVLGASPKSIIIGYYEDIKIIKL